MGRYRAPARRGAPYITPDGARRLREELHQLWSVERPQVTRAVQEAAALGDRSENAEYIYGKKRLREIDRRVRFLQKRLDELKVVDQIPDDPNRVYFGAWVEVEDSNGAVSRYRIVGPDEFDAEPRYISMDSPLARALLSREVDDEIDVDLPRGPETYLILSVEYEAPEPTRVSSD